MVQRLGTSDCHPRGPGFDSRLYSRNFSGCIDYGPESACLLWWLARLTAIQEVLDSIPVYTLEIFLEVYGLERGSQSFVTIR